MYCLSISTHILFRPRPCSTYIYNRLCELIAYLGMHQPEKQPIYQLAYSLLNLLKTKNAVYQKKTTA